MKSFLSYLGPGLLFASTSIGVSHLVQSTRAGADFGYHLIWAIVVANILKFPFFEFASRYAAHTKESVVDGYARLGNLVWYMYTMVTLLSMFIITAAVSMVTAGFCNTLFGLDSSYIKTSILIITLVVILFLYLGQFKWLNQFIKILGLTLFVCTLIAVFLLGIKKGFTIDSHLIDYTKDSTMLFIIALMGWMPTAMDLSAWNSLWTIEKMKEQPNLQWKQIQFEFNLGYWFSAVLALAFVFMGAVLMYGKGVVFSNSSVVFSAQVISLYTSAIGGWSYWIIATAAFCIMLGTMFGVYDGYSRTVDRLISVKRNKNNAESLYSKMLLFLAIGSVIIVYLVPSNGFKSMIDFATTMSFLIAPFIAIINFVLVYRFVPKQGQPSRVLYFISIIGVLYLLIFSSLTFFV